MSKYIIIIVIMTMYGMFMLYKEWKILTYVRNARDFFKYSGGSALFYLLGFIICGFLCLACLTDFLKL